MFKKVKRYFSETLWNFSLHEKRGIDHFFFKWLRVFFLSMRRFWQNQCAMRASSLTYYTIMSIVPVLALAFLIAEKLGFYDRFREQMLSRFPDQQVAFLELFHYADNLLAHTRGGIVAGFGIFVLVLTVILLLSSLESALNYIWDVKQFRTWWRILTDYLALMFLAPLGFVIANSISIFVVHLSENVIRHLPLSEGAIRWLIVLINWIPYALFWLFFTFLYYVMPNVKVRFRSALVAGVLAGTLYLIVQWGYIHFQVGAGRYGAIYGSIAAIPLFLIWLQISWFLFLWGAEISHAHQTLEHYEYEQPIKNTSLRLKKLLSLWLVSLAYKERISPDFLENRYKLPKRLSRQLLQTLIDCGILQENTYEPRAHLHVADCLQKIESQGLNQFPSLDPALLLEYEALLSAFEKEIQTHPKNMRLADVSHSI